MLTVDTSVAVPLLLLSHAAHDKVYEWARGKDLSLTAHALAETYSVLTRLPGDNRVAAEHAVALIDRRFATTLTISADSAVQLHRRLAGARIEGGAVYDGMIALTALEHGATLVSRDKRAARNYRSLGVGVQLLT